MPRPKVAEYMTLEALAGEVYELTGVRRCRDTVYKWAVAGRLDSHGTKIKLKTTMRLGRKYSTVKWLKEFIEEIE